MMLNRVKNFIKELDSKNALVFQEILKTTDSFIKRLIEGTSFANKFTKDEKEILSRELTASFYSMILKKFTKKKITSL